MIFVVVKFVISETWLVDRKEYLFKKDVCRVCMISLVVNLAISETWRGDRKEDWFKKVARFSTLAMLAMFG